jgi:hypothetical protein
MPMKVPPLELHSAKVLQYTIFDETVYSTDATKHSIAGTAMEMPAGLAIASADGAFYLLYCDENWQVLTDTWHQSISEAKSQAEFEFEKLGDWKILADDV